MCLSLFPQIDRIASPFIHFLVGGSMLAIGWLSAAVGALLFFMRCLCLSSSSSTWVPAAQSGSSFLCSPLFCIFMAEDAIKVTKVFFLDPLKTH